MSYDDRPRVEPAVWMWRGREVQVDERGWPALRPAPGSRGWWAQEWALRQSQGADGVALREPPGPEVRIGDTERDRAVSALGDHFAAGRLTREEFDERSDQAMQARFHGDLQPLFADLPRPSAPVPSPGVGGRRPYPMLLPLFWLVPLLMVVGLVTAVVLSAPWLVWTFFWIFLFTGFWGRRRFHRRW